MDNISNKADDKLLVILYLIIYKYILLLNIYLLYFKNNNLYFCAKI